MTIQKYDLFISHYQETGQKLAIIISDELNALNKNLNIFLDVNCSFNIHDLEENVKNSENILLLLTTGVYQREFVKKELRTALKFNKNIIVLWDKKECPNFPKEEDVDEDIRPVLKIFAKDWQPVKLYRDVLMKDIMKDMKIKNIENENNNLSTNSGFFIVQILNLWNFVFEIKLNKEDNKAYFLWNYNKSDTLRYIEFELNDIVNHKNLGLHSLFGKNVNYVNGRYHRFEINEINNFIFKFQGISPVVSISGSFKINNGQIEWISKNIDSTTITKYITMFESITKDSIYYDILNN